MNKLKCFCQTERGQCDCMTFIKCYEPTHCVCVADAINFNMPHGVACECVLFPASHNTNGSYLTNTHDVIRRGAT